VVAEIDALRGGEVLGGALVVPAAQIHAVDYDSNNMSVIDAGNANAVSTVPVGENPTGVAVSSTTNQVVVANRGSNTVSVVNG
jgi:YVTN family beta-propeller protein